MFQAPVSVGARLRFMSQLSSGHNREHRGEELRRQCKPGHNKTACSIHVCMCTQRQHRVLVRVDFPLCVRARQRVFFLFVLFVTSTPPQHSHAPLHRRLMVGKGNAHWLHNVHCGGSRVAAARRRVQKMYRGDWVPRTAQRNAGGKQGEGGVGSNGKAKTPWLRKTTSQRFSPPHPCFAKNKGHCVPSAHSRGCS